MSENTLASSPQTGTAKGKMAARVRWPMLEACADRGVHSTTIWDSLREELEEERDAPHVQERKRRPSTARLHSREYSSGAGRLRIAELHVRGLFVRLENSCRTELDIGGYRLQQNVEGRPVATFRFPSRTLVQPAACLTVWSEGSGMSNLPSKDLLWAGTQRILSGPECTTVVCTTNGQAVAWYTPAHCTVLRTRQAWDSSSGRCDESRPVLSRRLAWGVHSNQTEHAPFLLVKRKKEVIGVSQSPWTQALSSMAHPAWSPTTPSPGLRPQTSPAQPHSSTMSHSSLTSRGCKTALTGSEMIGSRRGPIRSAGPCRGGVMFLGPLPQCGSPLQQYCTPHAPACSTEVITMEA